RRTGVRARTGERAGTWNALGAGGVGGGDPATTYPTRCEKEMNGESRSRLRGTTAPELAPGDGSVMLERELHSANGGCIVLVVHPRNRRPRETDAAVAELLRGVSEERLRAYVDLFAFPRHYVAERRANVRARDLLIELLRGFGYAPTLQGS